MDVSTLSSLSSLDNQMTRQELGAQVVTNTLDTLNKTSGSTYPITDKQTMGAAVVGKTLDYMHAKDSKPSSSNAMAQTYDFSKSVLGAHASGAEALSQSLESSLGGLANDNI
ncbi:MAG: hypothetical protein PWQ57_2576 [Desulfovibrionales bacterium]|jgi:ABC-type oligopeptide transport system substrate-binding subunit|nr:hypothetical protein [Desulfovibrionales bacterium]